MDQYAPEITENNVSKLNSGGLINIRLHNLWVDRHKFAQAGKYARWNEILDAIWCELGADVKEDSEIDKKYWQLTLEYSEAKGTQVKTNGFNSVGDTQKNSLIKQKVALIKKELFLRRLQNKQGKGTAYVDEDDFE